MTFSMFQLMRATDISSKRGNLLRHGGPYEKQLNCSELILFNPIWDTGDIPTAWKESVVVLIFKPEKDLLDPSNYRPIAFTLKDKYIIQKVQTNCFGTEAVFVRVKAHCIPLYAQKQKSGKFRQMRKW